VTARIVTVTLPVRIELDVTKRAVTLPPDLRM
jgi:hypothetical protein